MRVELARLLRTPMYWMILSVGLLTRGAMAWQDKRWRAGQFWELAADFWNHFGSVTMGFLVLVVLIRLFSLDRETGTAPVIQSTVRGRRALFFRRLTAGTASAFLGTSILVAGNAILSVLFSPKQPLPAGLGQALLSPALTAAVGVVGYFLFSACVCDLMQNQSAAMCVCGVPYGISYFINVSAISRFAPFWLFRYGFFTELARGRILTDLPGFWLAWYVVLLSGGFWLSLVKRKERKAL